MRRNRNAAKHRKLLLLTAMLLAVVVLVICLMKTRIGPNLEEIGRLRANIMVSQIVNKALNEQLYGHENMDELLIREYDGDGQLELLQANTQAINLLITEISLELQQQYADRPEDIYSVPLGTLMGDKLLSQASPRVDMHIIPISVSSIDFETEIESAGINQTKYKVYMDLESQVKVAAPLVSETFKTSTTVLIAEAVILGTVPDNYVNVPKEDILDVTVE